MGEEKKKAGDSADAMHALARDAGREPASDEPKPVDLEAPREQVPVWEQDEPAPEESAREKALAEVVESVAPPDGAAAPARADNWKARARAHFSHQYKQIMIPLLVVVGGLLVALSAATVVMIAQSSPPGDGVLVQAPLLQRYGRLAVAVAMPVAAALLVGAWLFHRDVKRVERP